MDPQTLELLGQLGLLSAEQVAVLSDLGGAAAPTLDEVERALVETAEERLSDEGFDDQGLVEVQAMAAAVEAIRTERAARPDPATLLAELAARLRGIEPPPRTPALPARRHRRPLGMSTGPRGAGTSLVASSGRPLADGTALAEEVGARVHDTGSSNVTGRLRVATLTASYPEGRRLSMDPDRNGELIAAVVGPQALVASGGLCAPSGVRWTVPSLGTDARPVRDEALVGFQATRGGVRFVRPWTVGQVAGAVDTWTAATDANPGTSTKPCLTLTCHTEVEITCQAVTRCLQVGNLRTRFRPEQVRQAMEAVSHAHARLAEQELLTAMVTGSTQVNTGQLLGTARDVLTSLDRAVASLRARHRMDRRAVVRFVAPAWLLDMIRSDLAREMPGSTAERLATADAEVGRWLAARAIVATWSLDMGVSAFSAQATGPLVGWPSTVETIVYPEGSWLFLDGGTLDLGIVRDSTLNVTNDYQVFAETFEAVALVGVESLALTMDLCPSGEASAVVTVAPCTTGS